METDSVSARVTVSTELFCMKHDTAASATDTQERRYCYSQKSVAAETAAAPAIAVRFHSATSRAARPLDFKEDRELVSVTWSDRRVVLLSGSVLRNCTAPCQPRLAVCEQKMFTKMVANKKKRE